MDDDDAFRPKHRGRKSAAELAIVGPLDRVPVDLGPEPPADLTAKEREVWELTVAGMKSGWFSSALLPVLRAYCMHAAAADEVATELRKISLEEQPKKWMQLARVHMQQSMQMLNAAVRLRITPSSNRTGEGTRALRVVRPPKPWDLTEDELR
jgi:hypothetical protein